ncbi:MAG: hypothetical protein V7646_8118 [Pseudonocardia sp.]
MQLSDAGPPLLRRDLLPLMATATVETTETFEEKLRAQKLLLLRVRAQVGTAIDSVDDLASHVRVAGRSLAVPEGPPEPPYESRRVQLDEDEGKQGS